MAMKTLEELIGIKSKMQFEVGELLIERPKSEGQTENEDDDEQPIYTLKVGKRKLAPHDGVMLRDPDYVWRKDLVRDMTLFWSLEGQDRCMMLRGSKGSGKTSVVEQWHAALAWPLWCLGGNKGMTVEDLFGQFLPNAQGGLDWHDSPMLKAARYGGSVLINELNAIAPGITIALNDIAQAGSVITIPQTGEVIMPHKSFRMFFTANPAGTLYAGRQELDSSTQERPYTVVVPFMSLEEEVHHVTQRLVKAGADEEVAKEYAGKMVDVAMAVRATSLEVSTKSDAIPETLSTRVLAKWARYWVGLQHQPCSIHRALERALTNSCTKEVHAAIHGYVKTAFNVPVYPEALTVALAA